MAASAGKIGRIAWSLFKPPPHVKAKETLAIYEWRLGITGLNMLIGALIIVLFASKFTIIVPILGWTLSAGAVSAQDWADLKTQMTDQASNRDKDFAKLEAAGIGITISLRHDDYCRAAAVDNQAAMQALNRIIMDLQDDHETAAGEEYYIYPCIN